ILRFVDAQEGVVKVGGRDVRQVPLETLRKQIAVVAQDTYLFHGTIADNLRLGKPGATQAELEEAARNANIHDFIASLPQGYETVAGERGARLSGGQRQRIAIARAVLKNAPILVLDEALSSVDAENEHVIQQALERLQQGRTPRRTTARTAMNTPTATSITKTVTRTTGIRTAKNVCPARPCPSSRLSSASSRCASCGSACSSS